jgi:hypothetical protein
LGNGNLLASPPHQHLRENIEENIQLTHNINNNMDERISMLSALVAFIGMMILVYACIVIAQRRGVQIWSEPPPSPDSVV